MIFEVCCEPLAIQHSNSNLIWKCEHCNLFFNAAAQPCISRCSRSDGGAPRRLVWLRWFSFWREGGGSRPQTGNQMVLYLQSRCTKGLRPQVSRNPILDVTQPALYLACFPCPRLPVFMVGLSSSSLAEEAATEQPTAVSPFSEMGGVTIPPPDPEL